MHEYFSYSFLTLVCMQLIDMWLLFFIISTTINICIHIIVDWLRKEELEKKRETENNQVRPMTVTVSCYFKILSALFDCSYECFARIYNCSGNPQWSKDLPAEEEDGEGQACEDDRRQDGQQGLHHCIPYCIHHLYWLHGDSGKRTSIIMFLTIKTWLTVCK